MNYNLNNLFGKRAEEVANVTPSTGGGQYKKMVPPTRINEDGTVEVTGFVSGVTIKDYKFDEEKNQVVITYVDPSGATIMDWHIDPEFDQRIQSASEQAKEVQTNIAFSHLIQVAKSYVYSNTVESALAALAKETNNSFSFRQVSDVIEKLIKSDKNKTSNDISLKLLPTANTIAEDADIKYRVGRKNGKFIGQTDSAYGPEFKNPNGQYGDITIVTKIDKTPDFNSIDEVFSTPDIELL